MKLDAKLWYEHSKKFKTVQLRFQKVENQEVLKVVIDI